MARFNAVKEKETHVLNQAGGSAYKQSPKLAIVSLLLTSFLCGSAYESNNQQLKRLKELFDALPSKDKIFLAKAAIYARDKFGMRSTSHYAANLIARNISGETWLKNFFNKVVLRVDDMSEILGAYWADGKKPIPNSMKKGFREAFKKFDKYQLSKYQMTNRDISLIDLARLVNPADGPKTKDALKLLYKGELKVEDTYQVNLIKAGKQKTEKEKEQAKQETWEQFVNKGSKIEYFALLRNLRNIKEQASKEVYEKALELLTDQKLIEKSKVMPFRFLTAYEELTDTESRLSLAIALEKSLINVPKFPGKTAVCMDISASMNSKISVNSKLCPADIASIFSAALFKTNNADLFGFNTNAYNLTQKINALDSTITIANNIRYASGGTDMRACFWGLQKPYDRIIILSDMQTWGQGTWGSNHSTNKCFHAYKNHFNKDVKLYTIDLAGSGTMQFPEQNVYCLAGFSDEIFKLMGQLEEDPKVLLNEIEMIQL